MGEGCIGCLCVISYTCKWKWTIKAESLIKNCLDSYYIDWVKWPWGKSSTN